MTINIHPSVQALETEIIETRRDIHKHPELSFKEFRTAQLVSERLQGLGISVREKVGKTGVGILMVEQNAKQALSIADRGYVLVNGKNSREGTGQDLLNNHEVRKSFLGG